jgi:hypothetical protein
MSPPPVVRCVSALSRPGRLAAIAAITLTQPALLACPVSVEGEIGAAVCQTLAIPSQKSPPASPTPELSQSQADPLELDPAILEQSPVLQRWLQQVPEVEAEIQQDPAFHPRLRASYQQFPSSGQTGGWQVGVEDIFVVPGTGLAASADYGQSGTGDRRSYGVEARYYLLPLGGYLNLAPTLGYRSLTTSTYSTAGVGLGLRLMVIPSRGGGADLSLSHQWVAPGQPQEVGLTSVSLGYALTPQLRLGTDWQWQRSSLGQDNRWGLGLEWLL